MGPRTSHSEEPRAMGTEIIGSPSESLELMISGATHTSIPWFLYTCILPTGDRASYRETSVVINSPYCEEWYLFLSECLLLVGISVALLGSRHSFFWDRKPLDGILYDTTSETHRHGPLQDILHLLHFLHFTSVPWFYDMCVDVHAWGSIFYSNGNSCTGEKAMPDSCLYFIKSAILWFNNNMTINRKNNIPFFKKSCHWQRVRVKGMCIFLFNVHNILSVVGEIIFLWETRKLKVSEITYFSFVLGPQILCGFPLFIILFPPI